MKKSKGMQLGAMLAATLLLFVVFASTPASAYSAGPRWQGTSAVIGCICMIFMELEILKRPCTVLVGRE